MAAPHIVEIVKDGGGEPTGLVLKRIYLPVFEHTIFRDLPLFQYEERVESVRTGANIFRFERLTRILAFYVGGRQPQMLKKVRYPSPPQFHLC